MIYLNYVFIAGAILFNTGFLHSALKRFIQHIMAILKSHKQPTHKLMHRRIKEINETIKPNFAKQAYDDMQLAFSEEEDKRGLLKVKILCAVLSVAGIFVALYIKSYMLVPVLGLGLALLPMWVTRLKRYRFAIKLHAELSVTLSSVTSSYIRTENFIKAVEENLPFMKKPLRPIFEEFLTNYYNVDKSVVNGIKNMNGKLNHTIFRDWCHNLIICQNDKNHFPALNAIISSLDSEKRLYEKLKTEIYKPLSETLTLIAIMPVVFPIIKAFSTETLDILLTTIIGQLLMCGFFISILMAIDNAIKFCNPQSKGG